VRPERAFSLTGRSHLANTSAIRPRSRAQRLRHQRPTLPALVPASPHPPKRRPKERATGRRSGTNGSDPGSPRRRCDRGRVTTAGAPPGGERGCITTSRRAPRRSLPLATPSSIPHLMSPEHRGPGPAPATVATLANAGAGAETSHADHDQSARPRSLSDPPSTSSTSTRRTTVSSTRAGHTIGRRSVSAHWFLFIDSPEGQADNGGLSTRAGSTAHGSGGATKADAVPVLWSGPRGQGNAAIPSIRQGRSRPRR
jgi:hypothetical protein